MTERNIALSIEEAADYTGIGRNTLRKLVEWKKLRIGNIILFLPGAGFGLLFLPAQPPFDLGKHHVHCVYQITCLHRHR